MRKILRALLLVVLVILIAVVGLIGYLTLTEYQPQPVEALKIPTGKREINKKQDLSVLTFNIGYAGLGKTEDFFMDGGKTVEPESQKMIKDNLLGIEQAISEAEADINLIQEVDRDSKRSYHINQEKYLTERLGMNGVFASNFNVNYVPFPIPPIGKVDSGLMTMTDLTMSEAQRISLPNPFKWPVRTSNLKRALLETRFPIKDSEQELVVFNLHLEAYDSGEGKVAQSKKLAAVLYNEYAKGNYVIAGGDFNQVFEGSKQFPEVKKEGWKPGNIQNKDLPDHFSFSFDDQYPTVRVLNSPYTGSYDTSKVHVIDGFIVSDNLKVEKTKVLNKDFEHSDHHPVQLTVKFK